MFVPLWRGLICIFPFLSNLFKWTWYLFLSHFKYLIDCQASGWYFRIEANKWKLESIESSARSKLCDNLEWHQFAREMWFPSPMWIVREISFLFLFIEVKCNRRNKRFINNYNIDINPSWCILTHHTNIEFLRRGNIILYYANSNLFRHITFRSSMMIVILIILMI